VYFGDRFLGYEPRSENEVMLLLAKLEILGQLPLSHFGVYEYTPKRGVDALGDVQIETGDAVSEVIPIELENYFENFFEHGHPPGQVKIIVCWALRNSSTKRDYKLEPRRPGLYCCYLEGNQIFVVVISELKNLALR
jgi:hypothetical protein